MGSEKKKISIILILGIAFIGIISILYFYFIFIYRNASIIVEKMTADSMMSQTAFIMNDLNNEVLELRKRQFESMQMRSFNILAVPEVHTYSSYEVSNAKNDVENTARILMSSKTILQNVSVFFKDRNIKISAAESLSNISGEDRQFISKLLLKNAYELIYLEGRIYVLSSLRVNLSEHTEKKEMPYVFMVSEISTGKIRAKILRSFQAEGSQRIILVRNDTKEILLNTLNSDETAEFAEYLNNWEVQSGNGYMIVNMENKKYAVSYSGSKGLGWTLFKCVSEQDVFAQLYSMRSLIFVSILVFLSILVLFILSIYVLIYLPIRSLLHGFSHVSEGRLAYHLEPTISREFNSLFLSFNNMTASLSDHIDREYRQKLLIRDSQLKQLQLQINPHFIFNTFFIFKSMIRNGDYDEAERMSDLIGTHFEYIFHNTEDTVSLKQEMEFIRVYCEIQHIRYPKVMVQGIDELPAGTGGTKVPRLILQPVFENAFKYAFSSKTAASLIHVSYKVSEDDMQIDIEDNGSGINEEKLSAIRNCLEWNDDGNESALRNINGRLKLLYGDEYGLAVEKAELGGLRISMKIKRM